MNKKSDLTLVTCMYDIGRGNLPSGFKRDFEHYKACFARMLAVEYPMTIFCDPELNDFIWQHRSRDNTAIVNKTVNELKTTYFPFYQKVQEIRVRPEWIAQAGWLPDSTQATLDMYAPLVMSKMFFLNDASLHNFHGTQHFLFVDGGLSNTIGNPSAYFDAEFEQRVTPHLHGKMMFLAFPYQEDAPEVHGFTKSKLNELACAVTQHVCRGGLFGGSKDAINDMNDIYYQLLASTLNAGYMGTEESIFTIISYLYPNKCNIRMIESNGLIYKFLEDLKKEALPVIKDHPMAWYFLVFNTPKQLEYTIEKIKNAYPEDYSKVKKYVVNNSNDADAIKEYIELFQKYDLEEIYSGNNLGICGGRQFIAEHFDKCENHDYYVFWEEDMAVYEKDKDAALCKNGFQTYHSGVFQKSMDIMEAEKLDFLRLTFTEFFGDCMVSWAYINFPKDRKDVYYPPKDGLLCTKEYSPATLNKTKINYLGVYKGLPYAVGNFHYSNWPIVFNKAGNKKVFIDIKWAHLYEQTWMSNAGFLWEDGNLKSGSLLASPILHNRIIHYDGTRRRENPNYTN